MRTGRKGRLVKNTVSSLVFQVTTMICGFILPRLILTNFGSQVNGLVNSITQFLHMIAFLELGVGAVIQSSLYKPLAARCDDEISAIIASGSRFFRIIACLLLFYIVLLMMVYPMLVDGAFGYFYTDALLLAIGISSFAQYYFGVVDRILLSADQKGYLSYTAQTVTLILNTVLCAVLIRLGATIHLVKTVTSLVYLARPAFLRLYVNRHYRINRKISYNSEPIKQKWNGIAQHVASVVLEQTDVIVLTAFSSLANVSVYSVYHMVIYGVKNLFLSLTGGIQSLMGEYLARGETEKLNRLFDWTEWLLHTGTTFIFGCTAVLIVPFVSVYTKDVTDAEYIAPLFALCITLAHAGHCLRLPYNVLILAAGHYRQTQSNYIVAAVLNIVLSVLTVRLWGLVGVALGTLAAMLYQTVWMAVYDSRHILHTSLKGFIKHMAADSMLFTFAFLFSQKVSMVSLSYSAWIRMAVPVVLIWGTTSVIVNCVLYPEYIIRIIRKGANSMNLIWNKKCGGGGVTLSSSNNRGRVGYAL